MEDKFKFRVPVIKNNEFDGFVYINLGEKLPELHGGHYGMAEQCTGLKDKQGKLIYEEDIVKTPHSYKYEVKWGDGNWGLFFGNGQYDICLCERASKEVEIIGNIHENADLLGEE